MTRPRLPARILCLVTDGRPGDCRRRLEELTAPVEAAVRGGVNMVQVREKHLHYEDAALVAQGLRTAVVREGRLGASVVLNAHPMFALGDDGRRLLDGIQIPEAGFPQLGEEDNDRLTARFRFSGGLVGRSVHSTAAALKAEEDGADFLVLGTVFASHSHPGRPAGGLRLVRDVTAAVSQPVIGIGGITADTAGQVI